jgi:antitoxin component YwqK of YwqJK toxin-antitoxin module
MTTINNMIKQAKKIYGSRLNNCVFKKINDFIVILKKNDNTLTNEHRKGIVDENYAIFRANVLTVILIFDRENPQINIDTIANKYCEIETVYKIGCVVHADEYDMDLENVQSNGIHYFKTLNAAYHYGVTPLNYTGKIKEFYEDGSKMKEVEYVNGKENGRLLMWFKGHYLNGKKNGKWLEMYYSGKIKYEYNYLHGRLNGLWCKWHENGINAEHGFFLNDVLAKKWTYRYNNGKIKSTGEYLNGEKIGIWEYFNQN